MKSDREIQKDVIDELNWEPSLEAAEIGVAVKNGIVILSGTVDSYSDKIAAEKATSRVAGVKAVAEDIEVKVGTSFKKNDTELAQAVVNALTWNGLVDEGKIRVKVDDGWVTLEGNVEWEYQKNSAKRCLENLVGIRGITNLIQLKPQVNMRDVKQNISASFQRNANLDAKQIIVETSGNKVILKGQVRSLAEKDDAENAAWSAPGVAEVQNDLEVNYAQALVAY